MPTWLFILLVAIIAVPCLVYCQKQIEGKL
jgi:hypothetical protein